MNTWFKRFLIMVLLLVSPYAFAQFGVSVLTNNSGVALAKGSVIVVDSSADKSFTTTASERATGTIGVVFAASGISNGQKGSILLQGSYVEVVLTTGVITRGDFLVTSTTVGMATSGGSNTAAAFGIAVTESGGGESSVSAVLVSNVSASAVMLLDDAFITFGDDTDYKLGFVSATPTLAWLDGDDNVLMTLTDAGTTGNLAVLGRIGIGRAPTSDAALIARGATQWGTSNYGAQIVADGSRNNAIALLSSSSDKPWALANLAGGDTLQIAYMPELGDSGTPPVVVLEFDRTTKKATFAGDGAFDGGDLTVGSAAAGNIGTTTNPNQIQFVDATNTTIETDVRFGPTSGNVVVEIGTLDATRGILRLRGNATTTGPAIELSNAGDEDTDVNFWAFVADGPLEIRAENVPVIVIDDTTLAVSIGDGTNNLLIAADGFTTLAGTGRAVIEMKHNALQLLGPGPGNPPAGPNLTGHTFTLDFDPTTDQEVFTTMELPHNWAVGTTIKVNFHWAPIDAGEGTVTWGVETKIITPESGLLTVASVATQIVTDDTQTTQDETLVSDMITIDMSSVSIGDFLALRIFRDADASEGGADDDYGSAAQLVAFHIEYIVNSFGTDGAW